MDKEQGVTSNSPSALEGAIASSPEVQAEVQQTQAQPTTETVTPQTTETSESQEQETTQEEERIPYSRFKDVVEEKNYYRQQLENERNRQISSQQLPQPTTDPYTGMTPEEERFWRMVDQRAEKIAEQKVQRINPMLEAGIREITQMKVQSFRSAHPDIKPNSPDETAIAERIRMGYTTDDAYWSVMGPRGIRVAQEQGKQQAKQQIEAKKKANVETSTSVPASAQAKPKMTFREEFLANWNKAEEGKI
jgi:hypothetical protein